MTEPMGEPVAEQATAEFKGETFRLNDELNEYAVLEFLEVAEDGADGNEVHGAAALLRFVKELIHPDDRARFSAVARRERAKAQDLVEFLMGKVAADAERPTGRPSDSSGGPTTTDLRSGVSFDGKVSPPSGLARLRQRPDLALIVEGSRRAS